jgi:hypothetical protein
MLEDALHQVVREIAPCFRKGFIGEAPLQDRIGVVMGDINLKQSLQGDDSSAVSDFHS